MTRTILTVVAACLAAVPPAAAANPPLELVRTIPLPGAPGKLDHFALDAAGGRLFLSNQGNASLDVIDVATGKVLAQVAGQKRIHGIAYVQPLNRVFVGNGDPGECAAVDGKSYKVLKRLPVKGADNVQYDDRTGQVFVAGGAALTPVDPKGLTAGAPVELPAPAKAFRVDPGKPRLFLNANGAGVCVLDAKARKLTATYKLADAGGNASVALDPARGRVFVGCRKEPQLLVLDADTGKERARLAIPAGVDDLWYDAKRRRVYASCGTGFLAVVQQADGDRYTLAAKLPTPAGARTCLFDPVKGLVYLGVPKRGDRGPAEIRVYAARP
jgi:DNA-binding beta-propeller fold protein YncE